MLGNMRTMKFLPSNRAKVVAAFVLGAALAGSLTSVANTQQTGTIKACADNRTGALYISSTGTCSANRTLVELGGNSMNTKTISSLVTPSVVSIAVTASGGSGSGSGSVYKSNSSSSFIITNNHVIEGAANSGTIKIELTNGDQYSAKIVGRDPGYDLAVLQVQKGNLPEIALGDSSKVSVGDPVLAVGSPLGLASTVTSGIVSAVNRPVSTGTADSQSYVNAIQTDAAINPGNSGGALVDSRGRIIGVNSAIATLSSGGVSGNIGLGFSIPINEAKRVIDEIIATGKSTRPVLGVFFDDTYTGVGARIARLSPNEGAEKAGIPAGSVIKSIDGVKIANTDSAIVRIRSYVPGTVVTVVVDLPSGGSRTYRVTLGSAPSL
jgi:putative serine protease PepD